MEAWLLLVWCNVYYQRVAVVVVDCQHHLARFSTAGHHVVSWSATHHLSPSTQTVSRAAFVASSHGCLLSVVSCVLLLLCCVVSCYEDVWDQVPTVPSADPTLPSYLPTRNNLLQNLNNAQGEAFIAFDRDQYDNNNNHSHTTNTHPTIPRSHQNCMRTNL